MNDTKHKIFNDEHPGAELAHHLRLPYLLKHFKPHYIWAAFVFVNCLVTITILALLAFITGSSFVFPSLGPTAILFFMTPRTESARPRNALIGHAIGIICGYGALLVTGLAHAPSVIDGGVTLPRIVAAGLALAFTGALMVLARTPHAPAGATTLIIALGFITQPLSLLVIEVAVVLLVIQAVVINRMAGVGSSDKASNYYF